MVRSSGSLVAVLILISILIIGCTSTETAEPSNHHTSPPVMEKLNDAGRDKAGVEEQAAGLGNVA